MLILTTNDFGKLIQRIDGSILGRFARVEFQGNYEYLPCRGITLTLTELKELTLKLEELHA